MRAYTITSTSGPRRKARLGVLALVAACSLLTPSIASAEHYSSVTALTAGSQESSQPVGGADYSSVNAIMGAEGTPGTAEFESGPPASSSGLGRTPTEIGQAVGESSESTAIPATSQAGPTQQFGPGYSAPSAITGPPSSEPTLVSGSPGNPDDGFDWLSAAIGSAAAMALVALGSAAVLTIRRRTTVSPASTS
jgi:hypothetical protein